MRKAFWGYALLGVWACSIVGGLLIYSEKQLRPFDPQLVLTDAALQKDFDQRVSTMLIEAGAAPGSVVRLTHSQYCYCDTLVGAHQTDLLDELGRDHYANITLQLDSSPDLAAFIPSYPALAILDENAKLRYLGPYAKGYGCFNGKTLINQIVSLTQSEDYYGAVINTDANGCFCQQHPA